MAKWTAWLVSSSLFLSVLMWKETNEISVFPNVCVEDWWHARQSAGYKDVQGIVLISRGWNPFSSVTQSYLTDCDPMDCSTAGLPVLHQLPEFTQTHVHWAGDAIQPSHPLSSPSLPTFNLPQHQILFKWVSSLYQVDKVLEFQLQHQSFQWILRTDFL